MIPALRVWGRFFRMRRQRTVRRGLEGEGLEGEGAVVVFKGVEGCGACEGLRLMGLRGWRVTGWNEEMDGVDEAVGMSC